MKKVVSVLLIVSLVFCFTFVGALPQTVLTAGAATVWNETLSLITGETIPAAPVEPRKVNIFIFGSTTNGATNMLLDDLTKSTAIDIESYHFIYADGYNASKEVLEAFSAKYSDKIDYAYGQDNLMLLWAMMADSTETNFAMPVVTFIDTEGTVRDASFGMTDVDTILGRIKNIIGEDEYVEPPKNPAFTDCEIEGEYFVNIQQALDRLNEIRYEACSEGVINPATGLPLTMDDYHPLVWSSQLEEIARLRAAEAATKIDHERPNGKSCFTADNINTASSSGEILAWNYSKNMLDGIRQFYDEKDDWVNKTGGMTGHYEAIITPTNRSVGLGGFASKYTKYRSCLCGRFSKATSGFDSTYGEATGVIRVPIEVETRYLGEPALSAEQTKVEAGKEQSVEFTVKSVMTNITSTLFLKSDVTWTSSNEKVLTVTDGTVKGIKSGKAIVTATTFSGISAEIELEVAAREWQIHGDADNDGEISVLDATTIQRLLASIITDDDGMIALLGDSDGDGLNILDATNIQRYLAGFENAANSVGVRFKPQEDDPTHL